jgi:hypothetical protein
MKRSGTFIVLALAVALGLLWAVRMLDVGDERETANQPVRSGEQGSGEPASRKQTEGGQGSAGTQPEAQLEDQQQVPADPETITQPGVQAQPRLQAEAQSPDVDKAQGVDLSVVGRPFPVSESILAACGPRDSNPSRSCGPNKKLLDEMAEEAREEPWATAAERSIRGLVELEPGTELPRTVTYTIRALECRTSICFVETSSIMGGFATQLYYFEKTSGMRAQYPIGSTEIDEYGSQVHVTLWPFVRR